MKVRPLTKRQTILLFLAVVVAVGIGGYQYLFPYGRSHCCDKQLFFALLNYAEEHDGWFPKGEASGEASLSLLYQKDSESPDANLLRGKSVPEEIVRARLEAGKLLTPETCGWHYVDGLRTDDDSGLALFWDKAGLGHNGERLSRGRRYVWFVNGSTKYVAADEWPEFLAEQERLRGLPRQPK